MIPSENPTQAPAEIRAESIAAPLPIPAAVPRRRSLVILGIIGIVAAALVVLMVVTYVVAGLGVLAFTIAGVLALVPLVIVFLGVRWIDRWEPEPRAALVFAFLWGAGVAVAVALLVGAEIDSVLASIGGSAGEFFGAVIEAPIVEESAKGFGILMLFWFARKHFDGPVDGLVYAATIAGGFAFTENILYFGQALTESGSLRGLGELFFIRGLLSPFAHVMFTACTGLLLGLAARRTGALGGIGFFLIGLIPAIFLHALWNGSLYFVNNFYGYYAIVQFPLFALAVGLVVFLRRREAATTRARLGEYAAAGWFNPAEVDVLATGPGRRAALTWARQHGVGAAMQQYIRDATRLAFARERMLSGRDRIGVQADERELLDSVLRSRLALQGRR
ncbi:PrsW family intramembrane metalloprotease [Glaciihabitans sp. dw_435]|uniref:PrsW family intramembrane metalloprotease n=1 Tax=Glaciihabitans sp. dw_435 TaxID=2720081 RepID=UPI001BD37ABF|nr:PrsW family intramembrane metalloprotease [Glaciihabitans sp. dw_435]